MKKLLTLSVLALSAFANATPSYYQQVGEEREYYEYQEMILQNQKKSHFIGITSDEQKLYLDALEDILDEYPENKNALQSLKVSNVFFYDIADQFRAAILKIKYNLAGSIPTDLAEMIRNELLKEDPERRLIYLMAAHQELMIQVGHSELIDLAKKHKTFYDVQGSDETDGDYVEAPQVYTDLFYATPDVTTYMNGEYIKSVKVFKFCRTNRLYPCLMIMKDVNDQAVRNADGTLWTHTSLASSSRGLPSYTRNGNTPAGVYTIDSVMPVADQQISFGKFRRMILNFVPAAKNEELIKSLLPVSSHDKEWWKTSIVARDIGRNLLRIHGTGKINNDPNTPYFPFMRTSGCIAQRENTYAGVKYTDQRELLDKIMTAMELQPKYENEIKIKGILYLIELNDTNAPVTNADLLALGIN